MGEAKKIMVHPIDSKSARAFVKKWHYSHKVVNNSSLHFGCFMNGKLMGVLSYGSPFDKRRVLGLVEGTGWSEMVELNRMAFHDDLPRNSESRCIAVSIKLIKKNCPHIKWILSFADGVQCGDGTIYRASGFKLTAIKQNRTIIMLPDGTVGASMTFTKGTHILKQGGKAGIPEGSTFLPGFMFRYIYLIDKTAQLTVPEIPFNKIDELKAGMYKGKLISIADRKPHGGEGELT